MRSDQLNILIGEHLSSLSSHLGVISDVEKALSHFQQSFTLVHTFVGAVLEMAKLHEDKAVGEHAQRLVELMAMDIRICRQLRVELAQEAEMMAETAKCTTEAVKAARACGQEAQRN